MYCSNCGNKLTEGSGFCENCGAGNRQESATKSKKVSALGLTAIITSLVVIISCTASWFLFFAQPLAGSDSAKTTEPKIEKVTKEAPAVIVSSRKPDASAASPSVLEDSEQTGAELTEVTTVKPIEWLVYDAIEKPVFEDFSWYTEDVYENGKPGQVAELDFSDLPGKWKALFWYDPQNTMDAEGWDSLFIEISGKPDTVILKLDWQESYVKSIDSIVDMSALAYSEMTGLYDIQGITAGDIGYQLFLTDFYLLGNQQYAYGYMLVASGEDVFVALVRP